MAGPTNAILYSTQYTHPAQQFVAEASSHVGVAGKSWVASVTGIPSSWGWCAATICAIVRTCGFGQAFPSYTYAAATLARQIVESYGGTYMAGPVNGSVPATLQPGDLFVCSHSDRLNNSRNTYEVGTKFAGYHIGVVAYSKGTSFVTFEGNCDDRYVSREISLDMTKCQVGYFVRPDWTRLGASTNEYQGYATVNYGGLTQGIGMSLYDTESTRADATLRRVGYLNSQYEPSISIDTKVPLSLINYTGGLAALYSALVPMVANSASGTYEVDCSSLPPVPEVIVNYLLERGMNAAQSIGILGVIDYVSGCRTDKSPTTGKKTAGYGICAWKKQLSKSLGTDWSENLSGQLDLMWNELSGDKHSCMDALMHEVATDSLVGAKKAAEVFYTKFLDYVLNVTSALSAIGKTIDQVYPKIRITGTNHQTAQVQGRMIAHSGKVITSGTRVNVPNTVYQTGIIPSMTPYQRNWKYLQKTIYNMWVAEGRPSKYGIATLNGYYLVALGPAFATTGNMVTIVLEDGTYFNAILGDAKNTSDQYYLPPGVPFTTYGHWYKTSKQPNLQGWAVDVVEFEAVSSDQSVLDKGIRDAGWYGKKVAYVINYGPYFDDGRETVSINGWIYKDL